MKYEIKHECEYMTGHISGSMVFLVEADSEEEALKKYKEDPHRYVIYHIIDDVDLEDWEVADYLEPEIRKAE